MGATSDQVKGKAKEAAGTLTGDKELESKGKADRRAGEVKAKLADVEDLAEEVVDKAKGVLNPK